MIRHGILGLLTLFVFTSTLAEAQRSPSPQGQASTQVGGTWTSDGEARGVAGGQNYSGGKWIDVEYGRPILRGRENLFGSGADYGSTFLLGAPVWRLGANKSTRFKTETDLTFNGTRLPAGEYSMFAELGESEWTLILTTHGAKESFQEDTPNALWGSYGYTPDLDALRAPMSVTTHPVAADQLTIMFTDMTQNGGNLTIWWDNQIATAAFEVAR
tara:strand:+ start:22301 stop:22945 length:645 start_codon:yes stop_codon:yes gene_type:complete